MIVMTKKFSLKNVFLTLCYLINHNLIILYETNNIRSKKIQLPKNM